MQWCVMAESMRNSVHSKGAHGYGGIWGGEPATYHHNILAFHDSRNPRFCGSRYNNSPTTELVNFSNNVIYNWGSNSGYAGEGGRYNMINNYYRSGAATGSSSQYRIFSPNADGGTNSQPAGVWGTFYLNGNVMKNYPAVTANNWLGFQPASLGTKNILDLESSTPFAKPILTTQTAEAAYQSVTSFGGASLKRDAVDTRVINTILNGTISCSAGSNGSTGGFIDSQKDVGGWPVYTYDSNTVPIDTDSDGMPDSWETAHNLNPNNATDGTTKTLDDNYTNVEVYLNELVKSVTDVQTIISGTTEIKTNSFSVYPNPIKSGNVTINTGKNIISAQLYTINGLKMNEFKTNSNILSFSVDNLKVGVYIVKLTLEDGISKPTIILKQ